MGPLSFAAMLVTSTLSAFSPIKQTGMKVLKIWDWAFEQVYLEVEDEQEAGEERIEKELHESEEVCGELCGSELKMETKTEGNSPVQQVSDRQGSPLYTVGSGSLRYDLQEHLYRRLCDYGIGWFMPYSILIAYQESRFNIYAENPNGLDKGLFQYRITYYPGTDVFNPYEQIDIFVSQMASRAARGLTAAEMISCHMMSDYGPYNQTYVDQVMQHEQYLQKIN